MDRPITDAQHARERVPSDTFAFHHAMLLLSPQVLPSVYVRPRFGTGGPFETVWHLDTRMSSAGRPRWISCNESGSF